MITDEDIKVGQKYKLELLCIHSGEKVIIFETPTGDHIPLRNRDRECVTSINPYEPLKLATINRIPETAPKYDPCRLFRKGDIVKIVEWRGRRMADDSNGGVYTVQEDEKTNDYKGVSIKHETKGRLIGWARVHACNLELVTPVDETERYIIIHNEYDKYYEVCWKDDDEDGMTGRVRCRVMYWYHQSPMTYTEAQAKAAAEAERDRLNAEYRKERNNG